MTSFVFWPADLLVPAEISANPVPFTRSGGRSISGLKRSVRTDRGYWEIEMINIPIFSRAQRRVWQSMRVELSGSSGLAVIPVWSRDTAPFVSGKFEPRITTSHSDGTVHSDSTPYSQGAIDLTSFDDVEIGETSIRIEAVHAEQNLAGIRFSYNHALYETGKILSEVGNVFRVTVFPAIRAPIPAGAPLNASNPTCLVNLKEDRGMDISYNISGFTQKSIAWQEASQYWSDLAAGLVE